MREIDRVFECTTCKKELKEKLAPNMARAKCECGGELIEKSLDGKAQIVRYEIPEHIIKDIRMVEEENLKQINDFVAMANSWFYGFKKIMENCEKRSHLTSKLKNHIEYGLRKMGLQRQKDINWGYDPVAKQFVGFKKLKDLK